LSENGKNASVIAAPGALRQNILEDVMRSFPLFSKAILIIAVSGLSACATSGVSPSDLYQPHYGVHVFEHFDASANPDPAAVANGLYVPRYLRPSPSPSSWAP
jgi:hypothetical protein